MHSTTCRKAAGGERGAGRAGTSARIILDNQSTPRHTPAGPSRRTARIILELPSPTPSLDGVAAPAERASKTVARVPFISMRELRRFRRALHGSGSQPETLNAVASGGKNNSCAPFAIL